MEDNKIYDTIVKSEPITKGYSENKKYCVTTTDGMKYLLRISPISRYEPQKSLFVLHELLAAFNVSICKPIEFGACDAGVYSLQSWIDGEDLEDVMPRLSESEQYVLGLKAGEILRKIHSIPISDNPIDFWTALPTKEDWAAKFNRQLDNNINDYHKNDLHFDGDTNVLDYIGQNRHLLNERPQCFGFDDYNVFNMMFSNDGLVIIDFERYNICDPWEEFCDIVWSVKYSHHFATGQIRGYFGGEPPKEFWGLLALYFADYLLSFWKNHPITDDFWGDITLELSQNVLKWFDNMNNPVPTWYLKDFHVQYLDGIPYKLKEPFDFSFLSEYGKVFKIFDEQASGCICFGVSNGEHKYFIKFAGVKTVNNYDLPVSDAIARLKAAVIKYKEMAHPLLIRLIEAKEIGNGYMVVFDWFDGESFSVETPLLYEKFKALPIDKKIYVFEEILRFHEYAVKCGYVAMDFNDYSPLYNFNTGEIKICDIDFYAKQSYINGFGKALGDMVIMSPEEFRIGGLIDEISNVYTMGATAFRLFSDNERDRSPEAWALNMKLYEVVKKAVSDEREERQQSIKQLIEEWRTAK
jgi:serine/threonine-protein kinase